MNFKIQVKTEEFVIDVPSIRLGHFYDSIKQINKKIQKAGLEKISFKELSSFNKKLEFTVSKNNELNTVTRDVVYHKFSLKGTFPKIEDYEMVFIAEKLNEGGVIIPFCKSGFEVPLDIVNNPFECAKCNKKRARNKIFAFQHSISSELVYIGGECSKDFIDKVTLEAYLNLKAFINTFLEIKEGHEEKMFWRADRFSTVEVFSVALEVIKKYGYMGGRGSEGTSTVVSEILKGFKIDKDLSLDTVSASKQLNQILEDQDIFQRLKCNNSMKITAKSLFNEKYILTDNLSQFCYAVFLLLNVGAEEAQDAEKPRETNFKKEDFKEGEEIILKNALIKYSTEKPSPYNRGNYTATTLVTNEYGSNVLFAVDSTTFNPKKDAVISEIKFIIKKAYSRSYPDRETITVYLKSPKFSDNLNAKLIDEITSKKVLLEKNLEKSIFQHKTPSEWKDNLADYLATFRSNNFTLLSMTSEFHQANVILGELLEIVVQDRLNESEFAKVNLKNKFDVAFVDESTSQRIKLKLNFEIKDSSLWVYYSRK